MTVYLTLDEVLFIHAELLRATGGAPGVRDAGLIEAALLRPQTGYYADLVEEAAALWESLAMNHGFVDGNKRTAYACTEIFLAANGLEILPSDRVIEHFIVDNIESGTFAKDLIVRWLRAHTARRG